jgi:RNA polymerase sigma-70 factor (ECF subfamily)
MCILCARAWDDHGRLGITLEQFAERLQQVAARYLPADASEQARCDFVSHLYSNDLYLTTACALRSEAGWARFYQLYDGYLKQCLRRLCREPQILNELLDSPATELFLPDRSGESRILSYDGRASLRTWLRVIIANRVINEHERKSNALRSPELSGGHPAVDPKLDEVLDARRLEPLLHECLVRACLTLSRRERWIILSRYEDELQLGSIGRTCGIHQSTVTRILERSIGKLRAAMTETLREKHGAAFPLSAIGEILLNGESISTSLLAHLRGAGASPLVGTQPYRSRYAPKGRATAA